MLGICYCYSYGDGVKQDKKKAFDLLAKFNMQDIEILIPTFNEEKNLPITIKSLNENGFYNIFLNWNG